MKIFNSINTFQATKPTIVTIGTFDGVHLGHQKILKQIVQSALALNCESLVLTFFPHPRTILQEDTEMKQLNTLNEKIALLDSLGIDNLVVHSFDKEFSRLSAEEFVKEILITVFNVKKMIIGYDHRFGRNRTASIVDLIAFGKTYGFEVEQISAEEINTVSISSTKIRKALLQGTIELATTYLGYPYSLTGIILKGKQLGRTIGYPTANIEIEEAYKLIPLNGVYVAKTSLKGQTILGMMNIGNRPTVDGISKTIEINFFDFNQDVYGQKITISLLHRIRDEEKFESLEALKNQLNKDKQFALNYFKLLE